MKKYNKSKKKGKKVNQSNITRKRKQIKRGGGSEKHTMFATFEKILDKYHLIKREGNSITILNKKRNNADREKGNKTKNKDKSEKEIFIFETSDKHFFDTLKKKEIKQKIKNKDLIQISPTRQRELLNSRNEIGARIVIGNKNIYIILLKNSYGYNNNNNNNNNEEPQQPHQSTSALQLTTQQQQSTPTTTQTTTQTPTTTSNLTTKQTANTTLTSALQLKSPTPTITQTITQQLQQLQQLQQTLSNEQSTETQSTPSKNMYSNILINSIDNYIIILRKNIIGNNLTYINTYINQLNEQKRIIENIKKTNLPNNLEKLIEISKQIESIIDNFLKQTGKMENLIKKYLSNKSQSNLSTNNSKIDICKKLQDAFIAMSRTWKMEKDVHFTTFKFFDFLILLKNKENIPVEIAKQFDFNEIISYEKFVSEIIKNQNKSELENFFTVNKINFDLFECLTKKKNNLLKNEVIIPQTKLIT